jgi:hypothetical protein
VAEIVVEVRGVLHIGPSKTRASRRTVGLPRFVAEELAAHLAGHASVSFTLDRYGHLYPEADTALRGRLDARYGTTQPTPEGNVVRLHRPAGRGSSVAPGVPGDDESVADDPPTTL